MVCFLFVFLSAHAASRDGYIRVVVVVVCVCVCVGGGGGVTKRPLIIIYCVISCLLGSLFTATLKRLFNSSQ